MCSTLFNKIKESTLSYYGVDNVAAICLVGSQAWQTTNSKDVDIIVVLKDGNTNRGIHIDDNIDCFVISIDECRERATAKTTNYSIFFGLISAHPENLIYGELPIENYNWFDYQYEALLREYERASKNHFTDKMINKFTNYNCSKRMTWSLIAYYAIVNQSFEFTDEQQSIIQRCHDLKLPISYRDELKFNIEKILREQGLLQS